MVAEPEVLDAEAEPDAEDDERPGRGPPERSRELATRRDSKLCRALLKQAEAVRKGFEDQQKRADDQADWWACYNCELGPNQAYAGNAELYVPIIRNAVQARKTRFLNQIFPSSGRYLDATSSDGTLPWNVLAILEHYIRRTKLRTQVIAPLLINGDIEGQYNLYVDWDEVERNVVSRETRAAQVPAPGMGPTLIDAPDEEVDDIVEETIVEGWPGVEVLHDSDVLVLPATADSIEQALARGGSVTVIRRWTKAQVEEKIADGELVGPAARELVKSMNAGSDFVRNAPKDMAEAAGVKAGGQHALVYETWSRQEIPGEPGPRLVRCYYAGYELILSAKRCPFWNDRVPVLSCANMKIAGAFKGQSPVAPVASIQYHANDIANQAADSATYSMLPIIMSDPEKNPRTASMILNLAAIWECDPNSTKFAEFPKLWQDGIALVQADTQLIFQTLGVNPAMLPQQTGGRNKRNQAEISLEQSVDVLTTAEQVSIVEEGILTPLVERFAEYDHQFRDTELTIKAFGEQGILAKMEAIAPIQLGARYNFVWFGVEQARSATTHQQRIAWLNVAMSPNMGQALKAAGYMINPAPLLEESAMELFGATIGRQVLLDARRQLAMDPEMENEMLAEGFAVAVHPMDEHPRHIQAHMRYVQQTGDPTGQARIHIQKHQQAMQQQAMMMMAQQMQQAMQGQPGRGGGGGGGPRPGQGGQGPRPVQGPPGLPRPDALARGPGVPMPRRA